MDGSSTLPAASSRQRLAAVGAVLALLLVAGVTVVVIAGAGTPQSPVARDRVAAAPAEQADRDGAGSERWRPRELVPMAPEPEARRRRARRERTPEPARPRERRKLTTLVLEPRPAPPAPAAGPVDAAPSPQPVLTTALLAVVADGARVTVEGSDAACPPACEFAVPRNEEVAILAAPAVLDSPLGRYEWGGACKNTPATQAECRVVPDRDLVVRVTYRLIDLAPAEDLVEPVLAGLDSRRELGLPLAGL